MAPKAGIPSAVVWYERIVIMRCERRGRRTRISRAVAAAAAAAAVVLAVLPRPGHAAPAEVERLIAEGNQLRRQGQSGRALPLFQKAHTLVHTPRTEAQLGLVEMDAGYYVEAEKHLASALDFPKYPFVAANRAELEKALTLARARIGEIEIIGEPPGAAVAINAQQVGTLPLGSPVRIAIGRVDIGVTAPGHSPWSRSVALRGAERIQLTVKLERVGTPEPSVPEAAPTVATTAPSTIATTPVAPLETAPPPLSSGADRGSGSLSGMRVAAWSLAGGAVLAIGGGLALQLAARSALDDFSLSCYREGNQTRAKTNISPMPTLDSCNALHARWETDRTWSIVGYAAGGALAITSAVLFWQTRLSRPDGSAHARFQCAPGPSGLFCRGEF